jgi:hypothetical protein
MFFLEASGAQFLFGCKGLSLGGLTLIRESLRAEAAE